MYDVDWLQNKDKYISNVQQSTSIDDFRTRLNHILAELHNGHTYVLDNDLYNMHISSRSSEDSNNPWIRVLEDDQVKKVYTLNKNNGSQNNNNNSQVTTAISTIGDFAYIKIPSFSVMSMRADLDTIKSFLHTVDTTKPLVIDIRNNGGGTADYWRSLVNLLIDRDLKWQLYYLFRYGDYSLPFIHNKIPIANELKPIENLYTDSSLKISPEIPIKFKKYVTGDHEITPTNESIHYKGKIFLLVNSKVYSSSENFAVFAKETGWATLVGEKTKGDGVGFNPILAKLPNSHLIFQFPIVLGLTSDGSINDEVKTTPDIEVDSNETGNFLADPAIKAIIKLINK